MENYDHIIEGMLYIRGDEGLDIKEISVVLEVSKKKATELMDEFIEKYEHRGFNGIQSETFSSSFRNMAIVAYNQPITRSKVEDIRGVGCDAMIRKLLAKALIKEVGREESPGLPILYGVTDEFMDAFSLASLDELPELGDIVETESDEDIFATRYQEGDLSETN